MSESEKYLFDHFCLSVRPGGEGPAEVTLYSKGRPQTLTQQEAKTLQILVEKQGLFVETNTLAREVCGDDRADEGVIHTAISGLRRIFNDPAKVGEFIRNERKKVSLPPASAESPMEMCPAEISTAPHRIARRRPSRRSAIHPPGRDAR